MSMQYLDLMGPTKPHLLTSYTNGMGLHTETEYLPSTHYSLSDQANGRPWSTKLPFPVQCVSKVTVTDEITKARKTMAYTYHDGFYDGVEREFNGFGAVEVQNEETFASLAGSFATLPSLSKMW